MALAPGQRLGPYEVAELLGKGGMGAVYRADLRSVASTGGDNTLRLWPMPDLSKPPLHTLPYAELMGRLRALTNLRAVEDRSQPSGYRLEIGPFPGWKDVPTW